MTAGQAGAANVTRQGMSALATTLSKEPLALVIHAHGPSLRGAPKRFSPTNISASNGPLLATFSPLVTTTLSAVRSCLLANAIA